jgi:carotenoid cleavage dioxygenase-like enzyme
MIFYILYFLVGSAGAAPRLTATDALGEGLATSALAEVLLETPLRVARGAVPAWLSGDLLKQSASQFESGGYRLSHTFDGFGKLLRWRFHGGDNVTFRSRFLRGNFYNVSARTERICPARLLGVVEPEQSELPALTNNCSDNFNVNVFPVQSDVIALADFSGGLRVDMDDLTTTRHAWKDTWGTYFDKISAAHPATNGNVVVNYVERINPLAIAGVGDHHIIVYTVDSRGDAQTRSILHKIPVKRLPYIHSFTVTENYVILAAAPLTWDLAKVMVAESILKSVSWRPEDGTTIYVMRLDGQGGVKQYTSDAFFAFHHVHGWEGDDNSELTFDVVANDMSGGGIPAAGLTVDNLLDPTKRDQMLASAELRRYTLDLNQVGHVNYTTFPVIDTQGRSSSVFELPTVNPSLPAGSKYCFVYLWVPHAAGSSEFGSLALMKKNVCNASAPALTWQVEDHFPSEPVFVPRQTGGGGGGGGGGDANFDEDDGIVTSVVWDGVKKANYLLLLDAKTMTMQATLYCENEWSHSMSFGIHGHFFPK